MKHSLIWIFCAIMANQLSAQIDYVYEEGRAWTHEECIAAYQYLSDTYDNADLQVAGRSDVGLPIHLFLVGEYNPQRPVILINNAIHPGESCGVQASVKLMEELLRDSAEVLDKVNIAIIPMYNVGGALNRSCCTRANQNGPEEQGFRGNARHLDLNRDFIKTDSENSASFQSIFHRVKPSILVDTHTSNGADYPYTMTLIHSQLDMIDPGLAATHGEGLVKAMYARMEPHYPMVPYMNLAGRTPEEGIVDFPDWPRYSTGYAALFNCFGFTTETHMLKPFADRVEATYHFLDELIDYTGEHADELVEAKRAADKRSKGLTELALDYELNTFKKDSIFFEGYRADYEPSEVTGLERLKYNRKKRWKAYIPHWKHYNALDTVRVPENYYVPQAWSEVIGRMQLNQISMRQLAQDTVMEVEVYYIEDYKTVDSPYEGHYLHSEIETRSELQFVALRRGDYVIPTDQAGLRYIVNTLEPRAKDSFFAWGFFDAVLQQKEWFSPYVFEDMAADILEQDPELEREFREKQAEEEAFAEDMWAQLIYIYRRSAYYEEEHNRYPIFRGLKP